MVFFLPGKIPKRRTHANCRDTGSLSNTGTYCPVVGIATLTESKIGGRLAACFNTVSGDGRARLIPDGAEIRFSAWNLWVDPPLVAIEAKQWDEEIGCLAQVVALLQHSWRSRAGVSLAFDIDIAIALMLIVQVKPAAAWHADFPTSERRANEIWRLKLSTQRLPFPWDEGPRSSSPQTVASAKWPLLRLPLHSIGMLRKKNG
jgi:hypothetical protein